MVYQKKKALVKIIITLICKKFRYFLYFQKLKNYFYKLKLKELKLILNLDSKI
jgi:hypothetical protein